MSTEEIVEVGHKEGPAWKIVAKYATYEEADVKRLELVSEDDMQVKVHWQGRVDSRYFAVKTREDPDLLRREEKKRRKAKLSKKRRKK